MITAPVDFHPWPLFMSCQPSFTGRNPHSAASAAEKSTTATSTSGERFRHPHRARSTAAARPWPPKRESSPPLPGEGLFGGDYSDKKRTELVRSGAARKRLQRQWTNLHMPVPPRVGYRVVPLFDRIRREREEERGRRARQRNGVEGSSAGASASSSTAALPLLPPPEGYDAEHFGISLGPADFVSDEQMEAAMEAALQRSVFEAQEAEATVKLNAELNQHLVETALVISTLRPVIDLVSDSDDE